MILKPSTLNATSFKACVLANALAMIRSLPANTPAEVACFRAGRGIRAYGTYMSSLCGQYSRTLTSGLRQYLSYVSRLSTYVSPRVSDAAGSACGINFTPSNSYQAPMRTFFLWRMAAFNDWRTLHHSGDLCGVRSVFSQTTLRREQD